MRKSHGFGDGRMFVVTVEHVCVCVHIHMLYIWVSEKMGVPQARWMVYFLENPTK